MRTHSVRYVGQVVRALASDPEESIERVREKFAERNDARTAPANYGPIADAEERVHQALGIPWPCGLQEEFSAVWSQLTERLAAAGLSVGRGAFGGWDDGDAALVRMAYCLTRHQQPKVVVETGVARGLTTSAVLKALAANGEGHLWSIDLPPLAARHLSDETGIAVDDSDRSRWTLLRGSSRKMLPGLVRSASGVDLFIHDSMHTARNVRFELGQVWPALPAGGAALVDDVNRNAGFEAFAEAHGDARSFLAPADDGAAVFGCLLKSSAARRMATLNARPGLLHSHA